jgi:hypothetical protein
MSVVAGEASAQGTLSAQGFGYPPGQLSAYSRSLGGGMAETDPYSPLNPASLALLRRGGMHLETEQENRSLDAGGQSGSTQSNRFPLFMAAVPVGSRAVISLSFSTLLDRSWGTEIRDELEFEGETVSYVERFTSEGALNDIRAAGSWALRDNLIVGLGIHVFAGENRLTVERLFSDSLSFAPLRDSSNVNFFGLGVSTGLMWRPSRALTLGASGRYGGKLELRERDRLRSEADAPSRFGVGLRYDIVPGSGVVARVDRTLWSRMAGLGSEAATPEDTWDYGLGLDAVGPRLIGNQVNLRLGARDRHLPFNADGKSVRERAYSAGLGTPIASARGQIDLFVEHADRKADGLDAKERSWTFGLGLTLRP